MELSLVTSPTVDVRLPAQPLAPATDSRFDEACVAVSEDGRPQWQVLVSWGDDVGVPFREQFVWSRVGVVAIGGGTAVHFLDLATGSPRATLEVPDCFGHLGWHPSHDALYVLGWTSVVAVDADLAVRWRTRVAIDGVVFRGAEDGVLHVGAEMDPPGGWYDVVLDAASGLELARTPAFTDGYVAHDGA